MAEAIKGTGTIKSYTAASLGTNPTLEVPEVADTPVEQVEVTDDTLVEEGTGQVEQQEEVVAETAESPEVDPDLAEVEAQEVDANLVEEAAQVEVAEGEAITRDLEESELVSNQLAELTAGLETGDIPNWAQGAVRAVDRQLAARGISRSSIGQAELTDAIMKSALPIAQANAQALQRRSEINLGAEQQMAMQELNNEQQALLQSSQQQQQVLLSNQSAENAAEHFNATSKQQTDQFMANLKSTIETNNANRVATINQFNAGQLNSMQTFNAQQQAQIDQFNAQNSLAIAQSNVNWRRQTNLENTTATNAANLQDAQNRFTLSSQDMANRWQATRDLADWSFKSIEAENERQLKLKVASMEAEAMTDKALQEAIGMIVAYGSQSGSKMDGGTTNRLISTLKSGAGTVIKAAGGIATGAVDFVTDPIGTTTDWADTLFDFGEDDADKGIFDIIGSWFD